MRSAPRRPLLPHHIAAYALSLPERCLRTLAAFLGTIALGISRLVPGPIRRGKFFRLVIERQIRVIADDIGKAGLFPDAQALDARTATRLAVGGAVDNLLIIGLHASPLWMLLAATDVSEGARGFMAELGAELKKAGVMKEGSRLDSLDDVLGGLSRLSNRLSDTIDAPPLAVTEMKQTVQALRQDMKGVGATAARAADLDRLADDLRGLAHESQRSLLETSGAVALGTLRGARRLVAGTVVGAGATMRIVGRVVWKDVLGDYGRTIREVYDKGFAGALRAFTSPLGRSRRRVFAYTFLTFTEIGLSLGRWRKAAWRAS